MISAWKRLIKKSENDLEPSSSRGNNGVPPGISKLDRDLQRKFARGVNYNMRVVIKGDARVGKTSLFLRLKGYGFNENYTPTDNLNVTSINWNYKTADDIVKIDLWEAIDSTVKKSINFVDLKTGNQATTSLPSDKTSAGASPRSCSPESILKSDTAPSPITSTTYSLNGSTIDPIPESAKLSLSQLSESIDVYRGTDAVLLVLDMTKLWTFKYVQEELPKIPKHIPVLIIANHRDQGHHRTVSGDQVISFISRLDRGPCDGCVMYTEASMKNGFGLRVIEKFFNIPFLKLQEASFLKQLELNRREFMSALEELELLQESTSREYEQFLELQTIKRRQLADAQSPVNNQALRKLDESAREHIRNTTVSSDDVAASKTIKSIESNNNVISDAQLTATQNFKDERVASIVIGAKCPLPDTKAIDVRQTNLQKGASKQVSNNTETDVGSSVLDEGSDESDDEEPRANPLVADYQSDLDSDDQISSKT